MPVSVTLTGADEFRRRIRRVRRRMRKKAKTAATAAAEESLRRALEHVPRRTGALAASGRVEPRRGGAAVVFGGADSGAPYALVVHQSPDLTHPTGRWQWLRAPGVLDVELLFPGGDPAGEG